MARTNHSFKAPFTTPKTSKGIGIGSTVKALKKAYPKVKVRGTNLFQASFERTTFAGVKGSIQTSFTSDGSKRIFDVRVEFVPDE